MKDANEIVPEVLILTSFPPRVCGIASFSQNLIEVINRKFGKSFDLKIGAFETNKEKYDYTPEVILKLNTDDPLDFEKTALFINKRKAIKIVIVQHEFGFFHKNQQAFLKFLYKIEKPKAVVFHTVLPNPDLETKVNVQKIVAASAAIVVMTQNSKRLLVENYDIPNSKISVIAHGTHLVKHKNPILLKESAGFKNKKILSTFGLLNSGKGIEVTLDALPAIIKKHPEMLFLILGATHPVVLENEGEIYRELLEQKVKDLKLEQNVRFVNHYMDLDELLNYLQMTDIYLFTSKDPNQAVSGTFSYAMSCGCAIVSTPIPHAIEVLKDNCGFLFDFDQADELANAVNLLLDDDGLRTQIRLNGLQKIISTAWENAAIRYIRLFQKISEDDFPLNYNLPRLNLGHIKTMTTDFGMIQFAKVNQPNISTGYTIDDNARAMVAVCQHYEFTKDKGDLQLIQTYLDFIEFCQQRDGSFLNYVDEKHLFTSQNYETNLEDSNGRTIWALGYLIAQKGDLPEELIIQSTRIMDWAIPNFHNISSPRSMAFLIKGLHYRNGKENSIELRESIQFFADQLVHLYNQESEKGWEWFESYLTYANSIMPEALLCAYQETKNPLYRKIAKITFDFLLDNTFNAEGIKVISNKSWLYKGEESAIYGEQPIDVAYTVLALSRFYDEFKGEGYKEKMIIAFDWFLGANHLHQIIYNPETGGCYDGLERTQVNLNQGAESTVSYLMARLAMEKLNQTPQPIFEKSLLRTYTKVLTRSIIK